MFDLELIKKTYEELGAKVEKAKQRLQRPLTLSEKFCMLICMPNSLLPISTADRLR
jgi:hypothetical protein